jgi:hypothetical protein
MATSQPSWMRFRSLSISNLAEIFTHPIHLHIRYEEFICNCSGARAHKNVTAGRKVWKQFIGKRFIDIKNEMPFQHFFQIYIRFRWVIIWTWRLAFLTNAFSHSVHLNFLSPIWNSTTCVFRWPCCLKPFPQWEHLNGFSPVWILRWVSNELFHWNILLQKQHAKCLPREPRTTADRSHVWN